MKPKHFIIPAIIAAFIAFILFAPSQKNNTTTGSAEVGQMAPAIDLKDAAGKPWSLQSKRGSVVIVNFWATWCPPCRSEMPSLNALFLKTMNMKGLEVITILYRDSPEGAIAYMKESNLSLPFLVDPELAVARSYRLTGVPETFIIDKKGVLRKKIIGPAEFEAPDATQFFQALLAE